MFAIFLCMQILLCVCELAIVSPEAVIYDMYNVMHGAGGLGYTQRTPYCINICTSTSLLLWRSRGIWCATMMYTYTNSDVFTSLYTHGQRIHDAHARTTCSTAQTTNHGMHIDMCL